MNARLSAIQRKQFGFSLIELIVALSIGVFITLGAIGLFLQSKASFFQDEETARLQENGRWALRFVSREISMAGFFGGLVSVGGITTGLVVADDCGTGWAATPGPGVEHVNNASTSSAAAALSCLTSVDLLPGSDVVAVKRVKDSPHVFDGTQSSTPQNLAVYLRVEDYGATSTLVQGSSISTADKTPGSLVDVWEYQPQVLFIRDYSFSSGDGIPTLCRRRLSTTAGTLAMNPVECLIEGIENMQVEFGIDDSAPFDYSPDYYAANPTPAQLGSAVSAKVYLLARSINPVAGYTDDRDYKLGATTVAAVDDNFYRRVFQTTVMFRNSGVFGF